MKHLAWLLLCLAMLPAWAQDGLERITAFSSDIVVLANGNLTVTETFTVVVRDKLIRQGIHRDFPEKVDFFMVSAARDGVTEPFRTTALPGFSRVSLGTEDAWLKPGIYTYEIRYNVENPLDYYDGYVTLRWNVTGNGWEIPIERASARIELPEAVPWGETHTDARTGAAGAKGKDWEVKIPEPGVAAFKTTKGLQAGEVLTVMFSFPRKVVGPIRTKRNTAPPPEELPRSESLERASPQEPERILDFHSDIAIDADGSMIVTEDIRVLSQAARIRRGIFRDFPTDYKDAHGNPVSVGFKLLETTRDGKPEPNHVEDLSNGVRIYLGDRNVLLEPGEYRYRIRYRTTHQIGYFDDADELYWNVTGNGWLFRIDHASARIRLPQAVPVAQMTAEAYTGAMGEKGKNWKASIPEPGVSEFETTRALSPAEGLTVAFGFPKKIVDKPLLPYQFRAWVLCGAVLLLVFVVHYRVWNRVGRDPEGRSIYPLYAPPAGLSPGVLRTVWSLRSDVKSFTADLVSLAARGVIGIRYEPVLKNSATGSDWKLQALKSATQLPPSEGILLRALSLSPGEEMDFSPEYGDCVVAARDAHESELDSSLKRYFTTNGGASLPGIGVSLVVALGLLFMHNIYVLRELWLVLLLSLLIGLIFARLIAPMLIEEFPHRMRSGRYLGGMVYGLVVAAAALGILVFAYRGYTHLLGSAMGTLLTALLVMNGVFMSIMKAYTAEGRKLLDHIEGLRMYLSVAEKTDLEREKAPPLTAERYQALMPFAIALNVEDAWSDKLTKVAGEAALASIAEDSLFGRDSSQRLSRLSSAAYRCSPPQNDRSSPYRSYSSSSSSRSSSSSSRSWSGSSSGRSGRGSSGGGGGGGGGGGW